MKHIKKFEGIFSHNNVTWLDNEIEDLKSIGFEPIDKNKTAFKRGNYIIKKVEKSSKNGNITFFEIEKSNKYLFNTFISGHLEFSSALWKLKHLKNNI